MIPRPPLFALLIPFLCPPLLFSPFPILFFTPHCPWQYVAFASSITLVGVGLTLYLVLSSIPLKVPVHTGVSVQRRDRCTGRQ